MSRTQILRKPGHVTFDGATFYSSAPVTVEVQEDLVELTSDRHGKFDDRPTGRMVSVKFTPLQFSAAALAKLYPFGSLAMGASIVPAADKPIDIHTADGERYRIPCGFVFKEPAASWGVSQPILGEVEMRGILPLAGNPGTLAAYLARTATAYPGDTTWNPAEALTPACTYSWTQASGATAWDDMELAGPLVITPEATLVEDRAEGKGIINVALTNYKVTATGEPLNISPAELLAALGFDQPLGSSKAALGRDLKINATGAFARLYNAVLKAPAPLRYSAEQRVVGQLTWEAQASFTTGLRDPLLLITTTDPDA